MLDVLFINPDSSAKAYQGLSSLYSAIEPPTWALLLAESCRSKGFDVGILDCDAERLVVEDAIARIQEQDPKLLVFVLYGQNPNSGTTSMIGATMLAMEIKKAGIDIPICFVGSHVSALPLEVLAHPAVDLVLLNEGVYALHNLLKVESDAAKFSSIKGIGYKKRGPGDWMEPVLNEPERVVPQDKMDEDLPGYAWDLLPYKEKPLDLYRAHFWHADFDHAKRTPFAAIYTSLGCRFGCEFCMINIVNRVDNGEDISAADSKIMRFWSVDWVEREMTKLADMGVKTLRISDEMFFLDKKHYTAVLDMMIEKDFGFSLWAYARVDTVRERALEQFKKAGIKWLALGVEAGSKKVRKEVSKGAFQEISIHKVCDMISEHGIKIIANYIFGLPEDDMESMQETLDLAMELNTEMANMYPCQALPGSPLYVMAKSQGWKLPSSYEAFAFLSYECEPLPTKHLTAEQVLKFRDEAWQKYFTNPVYLEKVEKTFGAEERENIENMTKIKLKRKILGD